MFDYKEHELRKTVLRSILEPYRLNPAFFIIDGKTKCIVEINGWTVSFFVSSDDMQSFIDSLPDELPEILRNPKNALKFGGKYSVE